MRNRKRNQKNQRKESHPSQAVEPTQIANYSQAVEPEPAINIPTTKKGIYTEYLDRQMTTEQLGIERKNQLQRISELRDGRAVLVFAGDLRKGLTAPVGIDYSDLTPINDQISVLEGNRLDFILETPGGIGEVAEDIVNLLRSRFDEINIIVPGTAKSAGTIIAMAGDDILMEQVSSLGPIDAQITNKNKQFSAEAFITGLEDIKQEVVNTGDLNKAYIPILQAISPGEIRNAENAMDFAKELVENWLAKYKFKNWTHRKRTGEVITPDERIARAKKIADDLSKHSKWKTHARSIKIDDLRDMELQITDYSENSDLADAIRRYKTLLELTFETTIIFKIYETPTSQIVRIVRAETAAPGNTSPAPVLPPNTDSIDVEFDCTNCGHPNKIHAGLGKPATLSKIGYRKFPADDKLKCSKCPNVIDVSGFRKQIEAQSGKKII